MPAAASGKRYRTLDERCAACRIKGGPEEPCLPRGILREIEAETGRPCPRVEIEFENIVPYSVLGYVLDERLRPLASDLWRDYTSTWTPVERVEMLGRVSRALHDPDVDTILHPPPRP